MGIVISSGGVSKTYRYYPYDAFYIDANGNVNTNGDGEQVKEAYFNGTKYYPTLQDGQPSKRVVFGGSINAQVNAHLERVQRRINLNSWGDISFPISAKYEALIESNSNLYIRDTESNTGINQFYFSAIDNSISSGSRDVDLSSYSPALSQAPSKLISGGKLTAARMIYHAATGDVAFPEGDCQIIGGKDVTQLLTENDFIYNNHFYYALTKDSAIRLGTWGGELNICDFWAVLGLAANPSPTRTGDLTRMSIDVFLPIEYAYNLADGQEYEIAI